MGNAFAPWGRRTRIDMAASLRRGLRARVVAIGALWLAACQSPPQGRETAPTAPVAKVTAPAAGPIAQVPEAWRYPLDASSALGHRYLVNSDSTLATRAGAQLLAAGGNAIDAAITVAFVLAVVYPEAGNLGGGGFAVVRSANGETAALDFRETAPAAARRDMFVRTVGGPRTLADEAPANAALEASKVGHLAAGVPGTVAGLWALHEKYGSRPWRDLTTPAAVLAEQGFAVDREFVRSTTEAMPRLVHFAASRALFLRDGKPLAQGETFKNPDLARVLRRIAAAGRAAFYGGETAALIVREMKQNGGLIDARDLAKYEARWRDPIEFEYRGYKIVSMPPPSSGGVTLALIANMLEGYPMAELGWHSAEHVHLLAEAMSRAFADRNSLLGDSEFVKVPLDRLLSRAYADERRADIGQSATPSARVRPGLSSPEGIHTTHFAVVDEQGAAVSLTTTVNDLYGSGVTVSGAGFVLNNEMDDFAVKPGVPNLFGLVQGEANAIAPGKRMLSSMAPTLVLDSEGRVRAVAGARGGPRIISATWQVISNVIDFGMDVAQAVNAPRVHHQWQPDEIAVEQAGLLDTTQTDLEARGHHLHTVPEIGNAPLIVRDIVQSAWTGIADPRRGGAALGE